VLSCVISCVLTDEFLVVSAVAIRIELEPVHLVSLKGVVALKEPVAVPVFPNLEGVRVGPAWIRGWTIASVASTNLGKTVCVSIDGQLRGLTPAKADTESTPVLGLFACCSIGE
jgi:hypothetical protein